MNPLYNPVELHHQGGKRRVRQVHRAVGLAGMVNIAVQRQPIEQAAILMQIMEPEVIQHACFDPRQNAVQQFIRAGRKFADGYAQGIKGCLGASQGTEAIKDHTIRNSP